MLKTALIILTAIFPLMAPAQAPWLSTWEEAQALSTDRQVPVLLVFSGSDWCKPCIQLRREVFDQPAFAAFADSSCVLLLADFPRKKAHQAEPALRAHWEELARRYNPEGAFPLVLWLNANGEVLAETGYRPGGPEAYVAHLQALMTSHAPNH